MYIYSLVLYQLSGLPLSKNFGCAQALALLPLMVRKVGHVSTEKSVSSVRVMRNVTLGESLTCFKAGFPTLHIDRETTVGEEC